ncbi:MAG: hypothetical protein ACRC8A_16460 [Microcoleaceae cyanobacterium]
MSKWTKRGLIFLLLLGSLVATQQYLYLELGVMTGFLLAVLSKGMRRTTSRHRSETSKP